MKTPSKIVFAAGLVLAAATTGRSQAATTPVTPPPSSTVTIDPSTFPPDLRDLIKQLEADRDELRTLTAALRDELQGKTPEQKAKIIEQFRQANLKLIDAQRELARQIRIEIRLLRQQRKGTG
jgi:hypothetical protein